jgi:ATP-dependent Lon protease
VLPLLPLRQGSLLPGTSTAFAVGRSQSLALASALHDGDQVVVALQRDPEVTDPGDGDLHPAATLARVVRRFRGPDGTLRLALHGEQRATLRRLVEREPFWRAEVTVERETSADTAEAVALAGVLRDRLAELLDGSGEELLQKLDAPEVVAHPGLRADLVATALGLPAERTAQVLAELDVVRRLRLVLELLLEARELAALKERLDREVGRELGKAQREHLLRQRLDAIRKELGEDDETSPVQALRKRLAGLELPAEAQSAVERELKRLESTGPNQPDHHVTLKYLELIADLPWNKRAPVNADIEAIAARLDADHHGLEQVKKRILEHLAVARMTGNQQGAILCFHGPPGVGKTSLGQSIAAATGRPFVRVALGGVRDEAEIRGHRRTYVGALPGRILNALRSAGVCNPVILLDEIDKLGHGWMGSPEAALLEVLDPEQNRTFTDHYLELPFDLSEVLFLCTANSLDTLSPPLRDRLEIIELEGYTVEEKLQIGEQHLLPRQLERHGLGRDTLTLTDAALRAIVGEYTREAGVRQLTRELAKICRAVALQVARAGTGEPLTLQIDAGDLAGYLGKARFFSDSAERLHAPGIATGMAWTPTGGDILYIETSRMPGKGRVEVTGQLGDVMKESARAALSYVRSHAAELGVDPAFLETQDLHVHVPAGAVPKDGPSAGVTIFTALTSLLTGRPVRPDTAMTGECTLRGRVLPVGGIKAKVLAARRAGLSRIILPARNRRELDDIPENVRNELEFVFAEDMSEVIASALAAPVETLAASATPTSAAPPS